MASSCLFVSDTQLCLLSLWVMGFMIWVFLFNYYYYTFFLNMGRKLGKKWCAPFFFLVPFCLFCRKITTFVLLIGWSERLKNYLEFMSFLFVLFFFFPFFVVVTIYQKGFCWSFWEFIILLNCVWTWDSKRLDNKDDIISGVLFYIQIFEVMF